MLPAIVGVDVIDVGLGEEMCGVQRCHARRASSARLLRPSLVRVGGDQSHPSRALSNEVGEELTASRPGFARVTTRSQRTSR